MFKVKKTRTQGTITEELSVEIDPAAIMQAIMSGPLSVPAPQQEPDTLRRVLTVAHPDKALPETGTQDDGLDDDDLEDDLGIEIVHEPACEKKNREPQAVNGGGRGMSLCVDCGTRMHHTKMRKTKRGWQCSVCRELEKS
jgi:hypothetical protein